MDSDDEMDKGRTKKVKKYKEERHWDHNPFQVNKKDNLNFIDGWGRSGRETSSEYEPC
jgi:hypothetical protein